MIRRVGAAGTAVAVAAVAVAAGDGVEVGDGGVGDGMLVGSIVAVEVGTLAGPSPASGSNGVESMIG